MLQVIPFTWRRGVQAEYSLSAVSAKPVSLELMPPNEPSSSAAATMAAALHPQSRNCQKCKEPVELTELDERGTPHVSQKGCRFHNACFTCSSEDCGQRLIHRPRYIFEENAYCYDCHQKDRVPTYRCCVCQKHIDRMYAQDLQTGERCHVECTSELPFVKAAVDKYSAVQRLSDALAWNPSDRVQEGQPLLFNRWELVQAPLCVFCAKVADGQMSKIPRGWIHAECAREAHKCPECSKPCEQGEPVIMRLSNYRAYHPACVEANPSLMATIIEEANQQKQEQPKTQPASEPKKEVTKKMYLLYRQDFDQFDADDSGFLEFSEVPHLLKQQLGKAPTEEEINKLLSEFDTNGDNRLDFNEYLRWLFPGGYKITA